LNQLWWLQQYCLAGKPLVGRHRAITHHQQLLVLDITWRLLLLLPGLLLQGWRWLPRLVLVLGADQRLMLLLGVLSLLCA
jgi:hypothetical protein